MYQDFIAGSSIKKGEPLCISGNYQVSPATCRSTLQAASYVGISLQDAERGELIPMENVVKYGHIANVSVGLKGRSGDLVYLGSRGLTTTKPSRSGDKIVVVGRVIGNNDIIADCQHLGTYV